MIHGAGSGRCLCGDSGGDGRRFVREGKKGNIRTVILHFGGFCISPPGSSGGLRLPFPLSGKEAHVAVSSSPKNHPYSFRRKWLKPPATGRIDSSGVSVDGRFCADVSDSLLHLCHHLSLPICDEFAVPLR